MNANIAEYHVPVNADVQDIKVIFVDEPDSTVNPLGIKGVGEIGIIGVAAPSPTLSITLLENVCATFQLQSIRYSGDLATVARMSALVLSGYADCALKCPPLG